MNKTIITSDKAPEAIGPYSQAVTAGNMVFTSGQLGLDPATGKLVNHSLEAEADQVFMNVKNLLEGAGSSLCNIIKTTLFLTNMDYFQKVNERYRQLFAGDFPARSCVQVTALPAGGRIEMEVVAIIGEVA